MHRALYGLKQAPRAWFDRFSSFLIDYGFHCSAVDSSLFIFQSYSDVTILLVYVDDIILTGNSPSLLDEFMTQLDIQFSIKDLGLLHYFLGVQVQPFHGGIFLSQAKYMANLLLNTRMTGCKPSPTPMASKQPHLANHDDSFPDITEYWRIVGILQYLTLTRPDLCYAVNSVCQHMHAPTYGHF